MQSLKVSPSPASAEERVRLTLRAEIIDGIRPGGTRLVEEALAREFDVSRLPVRKALRRLIGEGLVDRMPRHGGIVHRISLADVADIAELHGALDVFAVREAATRRTQEDLNLFREDVRRARRASEANDVAALSRAGVKFRHHVYEAARNSVLLELEEALEGRTLRMFALNDSQLIAPIRYYEQFEEAFRAGDPAEAEHAMVELSAHFEQARRERALAELGALDVAGDDLPGAEERPCAEEAGYTPDYVRLRDQLREEIIDGTRPPGSVVSERKLAEEFGMSRAPVGEALEQLAREGLLTLGASRTASRVRGLGEDERNDLFEVCAVLDALAMRLAAQRPTQAEVVELKRRLDVEERAACSDTAARLRAIFDFRAQIYAMAGNELLIEVDSWIEGRTRMTVSNAPMADFVLHAHRLLYRAISSRDAELTETIYRDAFTRTDIRRTILQNVPIQLDD
ncbi:GntR family transcriptional regulator [Brevibacterium salitolerans]